MRYKNAIIYNLPQVILGSFFIFTSTFITKFYVETIGLSTALIAMILFISRGLNAFSDPIVGFLSDHTKTRYGRRLPWIAASALPLALSFLMLASPPANLSYASSSLWFFISSTLSFLLFSAFHVPYSSLGVEITDDYEERNTIYGIRSVFMFLGVLLFLIFINAINFVSPTLDEPSKYILYGLFLALIFLSTNAVFLLNFYDRNIEKIHETSESFWNHLDLLKKNKVFRNFLIFNSALFSFHTITTSLVLFFAKYVIKDDTAGPLFMLIVTLSNLPGIPFWVYVARKIDKKNALMLNLILTIFLVIYECSLQEGDTNIFLVLSFFIGFISVSGTQLIASSMLPDVVDYNQYKTGKRDEGTYTGMKYFFDKIISATLLGIVFYVLGIAGFDAINEYSPVNSLVVRYLFLASCLITLGITIWGLYLYPINREMHQKIRKKLDEKAL